MKYQVLFVTCVKTLEFCIEDTMQVNEQGQRCRTQQAIKNKGILLNRRNIKIDLASINSLFYVKNGDAGTNRRYSHT